MPTLWLILKGAGLFLVGWLAIISGAVLARPKAIQDTTDAVLIPLWLASGFGTLAVIVWLFWISNGWSALGVSAGGGALLAFAAEKVLWKRMTPEKTGAWLKELKEKEKEAQRLLEEEKRKKEGEKRKREERRQREEDRRASGVASESAESMWTHVFATVLRAVGLAFLFFGVYVPIVYLDWVPIARLAAVLVSALVGLLLIGTGGEIDRTDTLVDKLAKRSIVSTWCRLLGTASTALGLAFFFFGIFVVIALRGWGLESWLAAALLSGGLGVYLFIVGTTINPPERWVARQKVRGLVTHAIKVKEDVTVYPNGSGFPHRKAQEAIAGVGDPHAVGELIATLSRRLPRPSDRHEDIRQAAASALCTIGGPAVEPLVTVLRHNRYPVRERAVTLLGKIGDPCAVEPLIAALRDEEESVRQSAVILLGEIGDPRAVEPLIAALRDEEESVRWSAVRALGKIGDPRVVEPLIAALRDEDGSVRQSAVEALGKIGDPRAVEPLIAALRDEEGSVRWSAVRALGKIGDPRAVEPLIAALRDEEESVRQSAVEALGKTGDPRAVEPLIAALRDEEESVRKSAVEALGKIGDPRAGQPIIALLEEELEGERPSHLKSYAAALEKTGDGRAVEPLIQVLGSRDGEDQAAAARALGRIGDTRAVEPLIGVLRHGSAGMAAVWALAEIGDVRAVGPLEEDFARVDLDKRGEEYEQRPIRMLIEKLEDQAVLAEIARTAKYRHTCDTARKRLEELGSS